MYDLKFDGPDDKVAFRVRSTRDALRAEDADGNVLAWFRFSAEQLEVQDAKGRSLANVRPVLKGKILYRVLVPPDNEVLYELRREPDGDLQLKSRFQEMVYKLKRRDYGFKVQTANGETESRVRVKGGKISIRADRGATYLATKDPLRAGAVAVMSLESLPFPHAIGLGLAVQHWGIDPK